IRARPGFTLTAVVTLALGVGGGTAIFSLASAVLLGRLPYRDPETLLVVWDDARETGFPRDDLSPAAYAPRPGAARAGAEIAAIGGTSCTTPGGGEPAKIEARRVTAGFFPMLGIAPQVGRTLTAEDDRPEAARVVVLSHGLWQRRFGGDPGVV